MAGVISAVVVFNSIYPAIIQSSDAMTSMERRLDERLKSQIAIIHAAQSGGNVLTWVKNVGAVRVAAVEACDVFFGPEGRLCSLRRCGHAGLALGVCGGERWRMESLDDAQAHRSSLSVFAVREIPGQSHSAERHQRRIL
jgi:hypothetical protein